MCQDHPQRLRFQRSEKLIKEYKEEAENQDVQSDKKHEIAQRNKKKYGCYVLDIGQKDVKESLSEMITLGISIEECVNKAVKNTKDS